MREAAIVLAALIVLTVVMTDPVARRSTSALPAGLVDPLLNAWILGWDADRLRHGLVGLWDAPVFYPYRGTLAYSEHLLGIAIFTAPFQWLTGSMVLSYNVAFLASYVFAGAAMYLLVRSLTGLPAAAFVAALAFAFTPYRVTQLTHLQVLVTGWMPLGLWALHQYFANASKDATGKRTTARAWLALFAVSFLLQGLSNGYYLYFFMLPAGVVIAAELFAMRRGRGIALYFFMMVELGVVAVAGAAALAPIALVYFRVRHERAIVTPVENIAAYSADLWSYFSAPPELRLWRILSDPAGPLSGERALFLGFTVLAVSLLSLAWFRHRGSARPTRYLVTTYWVMALLAVVFSLGPFPAAGGRRLLPSGPYLWLMGILPGLEGLRVPARLAMIVALAVSVLAGFGIAWIAARWSKRTAWMVSAVAGVAILAEGFSAPIGVSAFEPGGSPAERSAYRWLAGEQPGAVLELPTGAPDDRARALQYQAATLLHGHPIVNGGYNPYQSPLQDFLAGPPSPLADLDGMRPALAALRDLGVVYIVLHRDAYEDEPAAARVVESIRGLRDQVEEHREFGPIVIWKLRPSSVSATETCDGLAEVPGQAVTGQASHGGDRIGLALDGDPETRWLSGTRQDGTERIELRLDRPRTIACLELEIGSRSLGDYPRSLRVDAISEDGTEHTLHDGSILGPLMAGLVKDSERVRIALPFTPIQAARIRVSQTGQTRTWFWSVHELRVWESDS